MLRSGASSLPHSMRLRQKSLSAGRVRALPGHGVFGRVGVYELMPVSNELASGIHVDMPIEPWRAQAWKQGLEPLRLAGAKRVAAGLTTLEEVGRVTPPL